MASSTFHPFARLPVELRLHIWETACFASTPSERCLQYVNVKNRRVIPLPCDWRQSQEETSEEENNESAYLIDGGLWRACKESREVIARKSHYYDWLKIQNEAIRTREYFSTFSADWDGGEDDVHPAIIETCQGEEECRMVVSPGRDIFCIEAYNFRALQHSEDDKFELEMSFTSQLSNKGKIPSLWDPLCVSNIALEFDRSWLWNDIPDYIDEARSENSRLGYFGYLLHKHAKDTLTVENLWIVDRRIKWFDEHSQDHDTVYRDYDTEYVEIKWSAAIHLESDEIRANSADFMYRVEDWLREYWDDYTTLEDPEPKDIFRLLVRRDNEVEDPRIGREPGAVTKAEGFGWVIFDVDESDRDLDQYLSLWDESDIDSHCSEFRRRYY
ncbi:hypothetical protein NW752_007630 [Fusarium irregulare]|uniref:2EXR domain-containing protein n=1 Tax=Fusarium irregulare TaxID=2494466 RepID=A0A9W8PI83_9HYPO|nr:hypothetical protein NW766_010074 [Fusarium irregulare]KAJ4013333.1 hypothetical protein NW752_007630 [Fusarium irregulare]